MGKEQFEKRVLVEGELKYSPNNEGIISVFRHGDKTPEGQLTPRGFEQAGEIAQKTERVGVAAKDYGSIAQRTQDMAKEMVDKLVGGKPKDPTTGEDQYKSRVAEGLSFMEKGQKPQWIMENWGVLAQQGPNKPLETYLAFGEKRPDKTTLSPKEMASRAAEVLLVQIRTIGRLKSGSKVNLADASHSPTLDVFVAEFLKEQIEKDPIDSEGKSLVEKMGGAFNTAEGFEIHIKTDEKGQLSAGLKFRGKEYTIDLDKLRVLSSFYKEKVRAQ